MIITPQAFEKFIFLRRQEKLILTPTIREDLPEIYSWIQNIQVAQFLRNGNTSSIPRNAILDFDWSRATQDCLHYSIRMEDNTLIGTMMVRIDKITNEAHWTFSVIGKENLRGSGLGTHAKRLLLDELVFRYKVEKILTEVNVNNTASRRFNEKCGFRESGKDGSLLELTLHRNTWKKLVHS